VTIVTTTGILLRSMNYRETSKIFRFYTLDHGLVSLIAKGIRRKRPSGSEGLESFARGEVTFYRKRKGNLHLLKEFALKKSARGLGKSIFRFTAASVLGEIMLVQGTSERNPDVYSRLEIGFGRIEDSSDRLIMSVLLREAWSLVSTLGYRPEISRCIKCGLKMVEDGIGRFDLEAGGILCSVCGKNNDGPRMGPLARAQLMDFFNLEEDKEPIMGNKGHLLLLRNFISYHVVEKGVLNSFDFLNFLLESELKGIVGNSESS